MLKVIFVDWNGGRRLCCHLPEPVVAHCLWGGLKDEDPTCKQSGISMTYFSHFMSVQAIYEQGHFAKKLISRVSLGHLKKRTLKYSTVCINYSSDCLKK